MPNLAKDTNFYLSRKFFDRDEAEELANHLETQDIHSAKIEITHNGHATTMLTIECWSTLELERYAAMIDRYFNPEPPKKAVTFSSGPSM